MKRKLLYVLPLFFLASCGGNTGETENTQPATDPASETPIAAASPASPAGPAKRSANPCFADRTRCDVVTCQEQIVVFHMITKEKFDMMEKLCAGTGNPFSYGDVKKCIDTVSCQTHYLRVHGDDEQLDTDDDIEFDALRLTADQRESADKNNSFIARADTIKINYSIPLLKGVLSRVPTNSQFTFYKAKKLNSHELDIIFKVRLGTTNNYEYYDVSDTQP